MAKEKYKALYVLKGRNIILVGKDCFLVKASWKEEYDGH